MANKTVLNPVFSAVKVGNKAALLEKKNNKAMLQGLLLSLDSKEKRKTLVNKYFSGLDKQAKEGLGIILELVFLKQ